MVKHNSIFSKLFSYRQRESHSPLENYLIEILTYCLENDKAFRNEFNLLLGVIFLPEEEFKVSSQYIAADFGRPDIVIETENKIILIECKVESSENPKQLSRYSEYLLSNHRNKEKHLIYLTKYFDQKDLPNDEDHPRFLPLRWHEIYTIIQENHQQITKELKKLLKAHGMEDPKNFSIEDLLALKTISSTISKMDEVLAYFEQEFKNRFGDFSQYHSRSTQLINRGYSGYKSLQFKEIRYEINVGFWWWEDDLENPFFGLVITIPKRKSNSIELLKIYQDNLNFETQNWELKDRGDYKICYLKPISDFIGSKSSSHFSIIETEILKGLNDLELIKKKHPEAFQK